MSLDWTDQPSLKSSADVQSYKSGALGEPFLQSTSPDGESVTHVRGILIAGSRAGLKSLGLYEQYVAALSSLHRDALVYFVASSWLPLDVTLAHFAACDSLALTRAAYEEIGKSLSDRLTQTFFSGALRTARAVGVDGQMWWALSRTDRLIQRLYKGGRVTVHRRGPKDALIELAGFPFASSPYFRGVVSCEMKVMMSLLCRALVVRIEPSPANTLALALSWV